MSEFTKDPSNDRGSTRPTGNTSGTGPDPGTGNSRIVENSSKAGDPRYTPGTNEAGHSRANIDPIASGNAGDAGMTGTPRDRGHTAGTGGTGYTGNTGSGGAGGTGSGGTGYTGGTGHGGGTGNRAPREPKSTAAVWIVGIVVVVGALAIWIARNTVDDADNMQARPGMEQRDPVRGMERTDQPANQGTSDHLNFENREGDQGNYGTDVGTGSGVITDDRGTLQGQHGTGTIQGDQQYPRFDDRSGAAPGTSGNAVEGTHSGGTGTTGAGSAGDQDASGTGTASDNGGSDAGTEQGTTGTGTGQGTGTTGTGTGTTTTP